MRAVNWLQIAIETNADGIEPVCDLLSALGITGFEIEDKDDFNSFLEENHKYWDYVDEELYAKKQMATKVKVYIEDDSEAENKIAAMKRALSALDGEYGTLSLSTERMAQEDWENNWKKFFKPIYIGKNIVIKPSWEEIGDTEGRLVFETDPGMTFGSGQHETTRMCVEALEKLVKPGMSVADLGCGSGILSVISLMLGAKDAYAADIDENSPKIAYENAARNGVSKERYTVECANVLTDRAVIEKLEKKKFDIVVANIVADVIIPLSEKARRFMKEGGYFICSGIIDFRRGDVKDALIKNGFTVFEEKRDGDWYAFVAK